MDYMTPKTLDNMYNVSHLMFYEYIKTSKLYGVIWRPLWNFAYRKGYLRLPEWQPS